MDRLINWLELPVTNLPRAKAFYSAVLGVDLVDFTMPGFEYALFPSKSRTNAGALVKGEGAVPSMTGPVPYLDGSSGIDELLARVVKAGGEVLMPKLRLSEEAGDVAFFRDSEGNRVGLQAMPPREGPVSDGEMQRLLGSAPKRFAFVLKPGPKHGPETMALQWEHARNMFTLLRSGALHSVTALMDGVDVLGVGTIDAASKEDVAALLAKDPAVKGGRLTFEVFAAGAFGREDV
ncbi:MAG: VOC family protein [Archangium sp.]|nr:VOC family protein [Archangium sp.]